LKSPYYTLNPDILKKHTQVSLTTGEINHPEQNSGNAAQRRFQHSFWRRCIYLTSVLTYKQKHKRMMQAGEIWSESFDKNNPGQPGRVVLHGACR
jgi:hypothetical protein